MRRPEEHQQFIINSDRQKFQERSAENFNAERLEHFRALKAKQRRAELKLEELELKKVNDII